MVIFAFITVSIDLSSLVDIGMGMKNIMNRMLLLSS